MTQDYAVCADCKPYTPLRQVVVYAHHTELAKELIHHAKYERAQRGLYEMATLTQPLLENFEAPLLLTHIPTASSRVRVCGYDNAVLVNRWLARKSKLPRATLLARVGQAHQVGGEPKPAPGAVGWRVSTGTHG